MIHAILTMVYLVTIESGDEGYGAYAPDLPGCVAVGDGKEEVLEIIKESIALHLELLREESLPIPKPHSMSEYVVVGV
jgi:predicted RNase H-like HicB family nuclease